MIIYLLLLCITNPLCASLAQEFTYSRACAAGQCQDWKQAQEMISKLMIDDPDQAELAYDNGVAAYRLQEFEKARAYFDTVTNTAQIDTDLKKRAHFNLGNTHVALHELPAAISDYEAVLALDANDERAKHNLEKVRQLLAQQRQKNDENTSSDQNQDKQSQDKQSQDSSQNNNEDQNQEQQGEGNENTSDNPSHDQKGSSEKNDSSDSNNEADSGGEKKEGESNNDDEGDQDNQSDDESAGDQQDEQQEKFGDGHDSTPDEQSDEPKGTNTASNNTKADEESQQEERAAMQEAENKALDKDIRQEELQQLQEKLSPKDRWMARLLQQRDKADEQANKQLIKATVDKNMAGRYGQNNW